MHPPAPDTRDPWSGWFTAWAALSTPGLGVALLGWGPGAVLGVATVVATPAVLGLLLLEADRTATGRQPPVPSRSLAHRVLCCTALAVSLLALATSLPVLLLLVLPAQLLSAPPVRDRWRRTPVPSTRLAVTQDPSSSDHRTLDPPLPTTAEVVGSMDDRALCRAWRHSFWVLRDTRAARERLAVVALRQQLLDEIARREPRALDAWLGSDPRPSGGPDRYLGPRRPQPGTSRRKSW